MKNLEALEALKESALKQEKELINLTIQIHQQSLSTLEKNLMKLHQEKLTSLEKNMLTQKKELIKELATALVIIEQRLQDKVELSNQNTEKVLTQIKERVMKKLGERTFLSKTFTVIMTSFITATFTIIAMYIILEVQSKS